VLPPAQITAIGAGDVTEGLIDSLALAGAANIIYIGDPAKPVVTVRTEDYEPYANIYVDLSESPNIKTVIEATVPPDRLDINKIKFGQADSDGIFQFNGILNDNITFFTDATSSQSATLGRPYMPKKVQLPEGNTVDRTVILELLPTKLSVEPVPSIPLTLGYTSSEALENAFRVKITYSDILPMNNVVFDMSGGVSSDFSTTGIKFYSSDGTTVISAPATFNAGDVIYVAIPLETGKPTDSYSDVFRFIGTWNGISTGYIRQVVTQDVLLNISVTASPAAGGTVSGGGNFTHGTEITVNATANEGYKFVNWTEDGTEISTNTSCMFVVTESRTLVANFAVFVTYRVNADVNNIDYGSATGTGVYEETTVAYAEAFVNNCYQFANWTIDGMVVSTDNSYSFAVTGDVNLTANFYALNFDTYAPTLWGNTFMLDLKKLREDGYEVTGCKWFKNGVEEKDTRTVNEFSYSAGPDITDLLDYDITYTFQLLTENSGTFCSSQKVIASRSLATSSEEGIFDTPGFDLRVYPNPLPSGSVLTIEGVIKDSPILIYNQAGICVKSAVAADSAVTLTLPVPAGIYMIRIGNKAFKIVIID
jgi:hypothetical protein